MIVSKVDRAKELVDDKLAELSKVLATAPGTSEARLEADMMRTRAERDGLCQYCGRPVDANRLSTRHAGACESCAAVLDKLLMCKSRVVRGTGKLDLVRQMIEAYAMIGYTPYALRGATGDRSQVEKALREALYADAYWRAEVKAARVRKTEEFLEDKRRQEILDILVQLGADPSAEETKKRVDEIYYTTHYSK